MYDVPIKNIARCTPRPKSIFYRRFTTLIIILKSRCNICVGNNIINIQHRISIEN